MTVTVANDELKTLKADKVVDARGTACPGPIIAAKKAVGSVPVGGIMEVMSTDSGSLKDIPAWSKKMGYEFLGSFDEAGYLRLFVQRTR